MNNQLVMLWELLISVHRAQRVPHTASLGWEVLKGRRFFFLIPFFFFPPLVTVGFGWSSINSTTSTGSSAGVNFTHLLQKQTLPFTVGIFLLSWVYTICKCWSWSVQLRNFEKGTQIFNALLVDVQFFSPCFYCLCCWLVKWLFVEIFFRNMSPNYARSIWVKHGPCVGTKPKNSQNGIFFGQPCLI